MSVAGKLALLGVAVVVGALAGFALLQRGGAEGSEQARGGAEQAEQGLGFDLGLREGRTVTVSASISPRAHLFGDAILAEAELVLDPRRVRPETVRIDADFEPYQQLGDPRVLRSDGDDLVRLRYQYTLRCVAPGCEPVGARKETDMPVAQVVYRLGGERIVDTFNWPSIKTASRISAADLEQARWRADVTGLQDVSYRVSPGVLGAALAGGAGLLGLGGLALLFLLLPGRTGDSVEDDAQTISPLERALTGVRDASANGATPEQRKALERLARELGRVGRVDLAARSRRLAWSPQRPEGDALRHLHGDVEAELGRVE